MCEYVNKNRDSHQFHNHTQAFSLYTRVYYNHFWASNIPSISDFQKSEWAGPRLMSERARLADALFPALTSLSSSLGENSTDQSAIAHIFESRRSTGSAEAPWIQRLTPGS